MVRVWIETSSTVARAGFESLLTGSAEIDIVDSPERADVILSDDLPTGADGSSVPVVLLASEPITALAVRWGVRAMLAPHAPAVQIIAAIHAAAAGLIAIPATSSSFLVPAPAKKDGDMEALTPRELEAFEMLAEGLSNKQIAAKLRVSEHTAKFHVNSILSKLHAGTRTEAVMRGLRLGILKV